MSNGPLFDYGRSQEAKKAGMDQVEGNAERWVDRARQEARAICKIQGEVCSDMVRSAMEVSLDWFPHHSNAYGTVFRGGEWEWTGRWHTSTLVTNHGRVQRIWRLK
jgi:hypothetical protein